MHFLYILQCNNGTYYVGITKNFRKRLREHTRGFSKSTQYRLPVQLKFLACFPTKKKAAEFEQYLKSHSGKAFLSKRLV